MFHRNEVSSNLACDADSLIYKVAATTKTLEAAKRRFVQEALTLHFLADADVTRLHLTPKHCRKAGRFNIIATQPYQGNRDKQKGKPPLVEPLRYAAGREQLELPPELVMVFNDVYEADDSVVMECHENPNTIFYSEDKDLNCLLNRRLCHKTSTVLPAVDGIGYLNLVELSRTKKVDGRGPVFFWAQMLMGDTADHIKGITRVKGKLCGPAKTFELLQPFLMSQTDYSLPHPCLATCTEYDIGKFVLSLYKDNNQNPWPEGWLLWLYRTEKYSFFAHIKNLGLWDDPEIGEWLQAEFRKKWFNKD